MARQPIGLARPRTDQLAVADTRRLQSLSADIVYNPDDLLGKKGLAIIDDMRRDEQVRACLALKTAAVVGPGWELLPASSDGRDTELADLLRGDLVALSGTFQDDLAEILTAIAYGFSVSEKIWALSGARLRLASLRSVAPHDIEFRQDPFGNITGLLQMQTSGWVTLPPDKLVLFVHEPEFANPYGTSDLRAAHRPWWYKRHFLQWWAVWMERFAIPPRVAKHPERIDATALSALKDVVKKFQADTAITLPEGQDISLIEASKEPQNIFETAVNRMDLAICKSLLLPDKIGLVGGAVGGGSFALAREQAGAFFFVLNQVRRRLEAAVQEQLIDQMAALAAPGRQAPRFRLLPLSEQNKQAIAQVWIAAVQAGAVAAGLADENHMRRLLGFPEREETAQAAEGHGGGKRCVTRRLAADTRARPTHSQAQRTLEALPAQPWRPLRGTEKRADMEQKRRTFENEGRSLAEVVAAGAEEMVRSVKMRARKQRLGLAGSDLQAIRKLAPTQQVRSALRQAVEDAVARAYNRGAKEARGELRRIRASMSEQDAARLDVLDRLEMQDRPGVVGRRAAQYFRAKSFWVTGVLEQQVLDSARNALFVAASSERTPTAVEFELDQALAPYLPQRDRAGRIVNVPHRIETIARTNIADAVNQGRWATFTDPDLEGFVTALEYTAILDSRTRENHRAWDGVVLATNDPRWNGPPNRRPPNGFGCRCTLVPVTEIDQAELTTTLPHVEVVDPGFKPGA